MKKSFLCILLALCLCLSFILVACQEQPPAETPAPENAEPQNPETPEVPETPETPEEPEAPTEEGKVGQLHPIEGSQEEGSTTPVQPNDRVDESSTNRY